MTPGLDHGTLTAIRYRDEMSRSGRKYPQDTIRRLIRSMPRCCQAAYKHVGYSILSTILSCCNKIFSNMDYSLLHHFFTLIFGVSLNSALCRLIIFISIKRCGILSFLTHYPVHISIDIQHDIFPHWDLMCFQSVPLIFWAVYNDIICIKK